MSEMSASDASCANSSTRSLSTPNEAVEPQPSSSSDTTCMDEKMPAKKYRDEYQTTDDEYQASSEDDFQTANDEYQASEDEFQTAAFEYQSTDYKDETRMTITESLATIDQSLFNPYEPNSEPPEIQAKQLLDDGLVQNHAQAELAVKLIELRYNKDNAIWAATQCYTIDEAKNLLQKECELCLGVFPMNEIVSMLKCTHTCCVECVKKYFTQEITNRSITNLNCPYCYEPDFNSPHVTEDDILEYFSNLDILLKNIVDEDVHDLFQRKIRDRTLKQDPYFKWCVNCSSGFFARPEQNALVCPECGSITCTSCREPWESQHEGLTCEKYAEWKEANDPELQQEGVDRYLQTHGISCPRCKFRYSLTRGGCMHFTCKQCGFEFCYGCDRAWTQSDNHPRNCRSKLQTLGTENLQMLLKMNNVPFETEASELNGSAVTNGSMRCPIPMNAHDVPCNANVLMQHAGLCRVHYDEYLMDLVRKTRIDPLPVLGLTDCVQELRRQGIPLPERGPWDTDESYLVMCKKLVKEKILLDN